MIRAYYRRLQTDIMTNKNPHKYTYVLGKFMWSSDSLSTWSIFYSIIMCSI